MRSRYHIYFLFLSLAISSCASHQKEKKPPQKIEYSRETQKSFKEIEREMLLERYKRMRVEDGILQERPGRKYRPEPRGLPPQKDESPLALPSAAKTKTKTRVQSKPEQQSAEQRAPRRIEVTPEAQRREIQQNLTYFCMKMRNDSRFSSESSCEKYTQSVYEKCLKKFSEGELALTRCVKSKL